MKIKIAIIVCMIMFITHDGLSRDNSRDSVIRVQDNRPRTKTIERRIKKRYTPYPYYAYPGWGWGAYSPWGWGAPYYGPGYGPGFGFYVGF